jgi:pimeloyl-ACP methyl ester carboxylesterase
MAGMTTLTAHTGTLDVPGGRLAYDIAGEGPPLLLVHAGVTDRRMWDDVWDDLAGTHTVIRHDTRGFGETVITDPAVAYSNRADIVALLDHLGIAKAALCGVSRAGSIVIDTALEFPDRVAALIPVAAGLGGFEVEPTPREIEVFTELEALEEAKDWDAVIEGELRVWIDGIDQPAERVPDIRRRVEPMLRRISGEGGGDDEVDVTPLQPGAAGRIAGLRVPTLVIVGDLDTPETIASCRHIALTIPGARLVVLSGVAHLPPMEGPAEFTELLTTFLAQADA